MEVGLAYVLDKTTYFALLSRKWYCYIAGVFPATARLFIG